MNKNSTTHNRGHPLYEINQMIAKRIQIKAKTITYYKVK